MNPCEQLQQEAPFLFNALGPSPSESECQDILDRLHDAQTGGGTDPVNPNPPGQQTPEGDSRALQFISIFIIIVNALK